MCGYTQCMMGYYVNSGICVQNIILRFVFFVLSISLFFFS